MISLNRITAIILMGGEGTRFGSRLPKQFHRLAGKKIYLYTLEAFLASNLFHEILLVTHPSWTEEVERDLIDYPSAPCRIVAAGPTRQESSFLGLLACDAATEIVVVHDAVRPFVSERILRENIQKAEEIGAVDTCIPSADTLVYAPDHDRIASIPQRSDFFRGQTPQSFRYSILQEAHLYARKRELSGVSDDCRLVREIGAPIAIVPGEEENIKITTELDLVIAQQLLALGYGASSSSNQPFDLAGRIFAVTGAQGGIGSEVCRLLESEGARVVPIVRHGSGYITDLADDQEIQTCFEAIYREEGPLDGLINCAGILSKKALAEQSVEEIDELVDINLRAVVLCCKHARLRENGHIVNVASSSYTKGRKEIAVYACTKAAVVNFSQGLAEERPDIIVDVVSPQRTDTAMRRASFPDDDPSTLLKPEEVAREIVTLLKQKRRSHAAIDIRKK